MIRENLRNLREIKIYTKTKDLKNWLPRISRITQINSFE